MCAVQLVLSKQQQISKHQDELCWPICCAHTISLAAQVLAPYAKEININNNVMNMYLRHLLPGITGGGDDGNYGSSACYDVLCLQVPDTLRSTSYFQQVLS